MRHHQAGTRAAGAWLPLMVQRNLPLSCRSRPGTQVALVAAPPGGPDLRDLGSLAADPAGAGAVIAFARMRADLDGTASPAVEAARADKLARIA